MLLFGAIVGFVISLLMISGPLAIAVATVLGAPIIWFIFAPIITITLIPAIVLQIIAVVVLYIVAAIDTPVPLAGPTTSGQFGLFARGALIGMNAAGNFMLFQVAMASVALAGGLIVPGAIYVAIVNLLAAFPGVSTNRSYEAVLGWSSLMMPMSWLATAVGAVVFVINAFFAMFGVFWTVRLEWFTGTVVTHGGVMHIPTRVSAYNLGNFSFIHPDYGATTPRLFPGGAQFTTAEGVTFHETGHTLNVAAFGGWFHYMNALHEKVFPPGGVSQAAYGELIAESNQRESVRPWLEVWTPPVGITGPTTSNVPATVSGTVAPVALAVGETVTLDALPAANPSVDPDSYVLGAINPGGTPTLGFLWATEAAPPGGQAAIAAPNAAQTTLIPPVGGDYDVILLVTDGLEGGFLQFPVTAVGAEANGPYTGSVDIPVALTAAGSSAGSDGVLPSDADPAAAFPVLLTLAWSSVSTPAPTAVASFDDPAAETPAFTGDTPGEYVIMLSVTSAVGLTHTDTAVVTLT